MINTQYSESIPDCKVCETCLSGTFKQFDYPTRLYFEWRQETETFIERYRGILKEHFATDLSCSTDAISIAGARKNAARIAVFRKGLLAREISRGNAHDIIIAYIDTKKRGKTCL
jgi:hypothetical protein